MFTQTLSVHPTAIIRPCRPASGRGDSPTLLGSGSRLEANGFPPVLITHHIPRLPCLAYAAANDTRSCSSLRVHMHHASIPKLLLPPTLSLGSCFCRQGPCAMPLVPISTSDFSPCPARNKTPRGCHRTFPGVSCPPSHVGVPPGDRTWEASVVYGTSLSFNIIEETSSRSWYPLCISAVKSSFPIFPKSRSRRPREQVEPIDRAPVRTQVIQHTQSPTCIGKLRPATSNSYRSAHSNPDANRWTVCRNPRSSNKNWLY